MVPDRPLLIREYRRFITSLEQHRLLVLNELSDNYFKYQAIQLLLKQAVVPDITFRILNHLIDLYRTREKRLTLLYDCIDSKSNLYSSATGALSTTHQIYYHRDYFLG